jgi:2'-5' RNA ligase
MSPSESALIVLVPEAEALVKPFRDRHDPAAAAGMAAHITVLYPFCPPQDLAESHLDILRACLAGFAPFQFALRKTGRFPGVLYLTPDPEQPFRQLTTAISERFPDFPPYGGKYPDTAPHLTIAQIADEPELERVAGEFASASQGKLPIHAMASQVALMENGSGRWQVSTQLRLGLAA